MVTQLDEEQVDDLPEVEEEVEQQVEDQADDNGEETVEYPDFDGEAEQEGETDLVKHLRAQVRERDKRLAAATRSQQAAEEPIIVGPRPQLSDFDYDTDAYDKAIDAWLEKGEEKRKQDSRVEQAKQREAESWRQVEQNYATKKAALPYRDKDDVERVAFDALSPAHQAIIADVAPDPALFIYAAGRNPGRLNELASFDMNDPRQVVRMAAAIGRMGASLTMAKRPKPPAPQSAVRGGVARQGSDKELERLEKEADRTGDRTALINYKRDLRKA